jgi:hypothetical protein
VKAKYGPVLADVGAPELQIYDQQGQLITDLDDIPEEYFKKVKDGGFFLVIRTTTQPYRLSTHVKLASFPPCEIQFYINIPNAV